MENLAVAGSPRRERRLDPPRQRTRRPGPTPHSHENPSEHFASPASRSAPRAGLALADTPAAPADTPIAPVPPGVALRAATVRVIVAPDHRDWTYKLGEHALFAVTVTADSEPIDGVTVSYTVGPDMFPGEKKTAALPLAGMTIDGGTMDGARVPALHRHRAGRRPQLPGPRHRRVLARRRLRRPRSSPRISTRSGPRARRTSEKVPVDARMTLVPEACTSTVDVYHVSFRTVGPKGPVSARIYGILCEPRAPGRYAAILKVPGAGVRPYFGDPELAAKGAIVLEIGIHGIPVNLAKEVYDELGAGRAQRLLVLQPRRPRPVLLPARLPELHPGERLPHLPAELGRQAPARDGREPGRTADDRDGRPRPARDRAVGHPPRVLRRERRAPRARRGLAPPVHAGAGRRALRPGHARQDRDRRLLRHRQFRAPRARARATTTGDTTTRPARRPRPSPSTTRSPPRRRSGSPSSSATATRSSSTTRYPAGSRASSASSSPGPSDDDPSARLGRHGGSGTARARRGCPPPSRAASTPTFAARGGSPTRSGGRTRPASSGSRSATGSTRRRSRLAPTCSARRWSTSRRTGWTRWRPCASTAAWSPARRTCSSATAGT